MEKPPLNSAQRGLLLLLGALTALGPLSIDMYLPAFPAISLDLHASLASIQHTVSLFFAGMAVGQLIYGPLSDRFGRKGPLLIGLCIYAVAAAGCATAHSVGELTAWRLLQAVGGCSGIIVVRAIVRDLFDTQNAARVFSQLVLIMGAAPILAPFMGGQILLHLGWRAIFWLLTAYSLICVVVVAAVLRETHHERKPFSPSSTLRTFRLVMSDLTFFVPAIMAAFSLSAMFTYIVSSSAIFIDYFGVRPENFGFFFGANACGLIAASQFNARLLRSTTPERILKTSTLATSAIGLLLLALAWTGFGGLWGMAAAFFLLLICLGFVSANASACALNNQRAHAGSASALLGTLQFAVAAFVGSAVSHAVTWPGIGNAPRAASLLIFLTTLAAAGVYLCGKSALSSTPKPA